MRVFDLHCDTLSACMEQGQSLLRNHLQLDLQRGRNFEKWIQTFAFFIPDDYRKEAAWQYFQKLYRFWEQEKKLAGNRIRMVTEESLPETECLAMLAIEGGGVLGGDLKKAAMLKDMGISILTLCWNGANEIAGGAHSNERLTPFGKELIAELERLDVIVDVSHLNEDFNSGYTEVAIPAHSSKTYTFNACAKQYCTIFGAVDKSRITFFTDAGSYNYYLKSGTVELVQ